MKSPALSAIIFGTYLLAQNTNQTNSIYSLPIIEFPQSQRSIKKQTIEIPQIYFSNKFYSVSFNFHHPISTNILYNIGPETASSLLLQHTSTFFEQIQHTNLLYEFYKLNLVNSLLTETRIINSTNTPPSKKIQIVPQDTTEI